MNANLGRGAWLLVLTLLLLAGGMETQAGAQTPTPAQIKDTVPLTPRRLDNLIAFTRLMGYVRHFYPGDGAAQMDWDRFAVAGMKTVESAKNAPELADKLNTLFAGVAPTVQVLEANSDRATDTLPLSKGLSIVRWEHHGFGYKGPGSLYAKDPDPMYHSTRIRKPLGKNGALPAGFPDPTKPFTAVLNNEGIACSVPLAVYADAKGTLPHRLRPAFPPIVIGENGLDRATRFADVALAWNVLEHFYPYHEAVKTDWLDTLRTALKSAATDKNDRDFLRTLRLMIAGLHDGHGGVSRPDLSGGAMPPLLWDWIEGQLVITVVGSDRIRNLKPGDVVMQINGRPAIDVLTEREQLASGSTPQWIRHRALNAILNGDPFTNLKLTVRRGFDSPHTVTLQRTTGPGLVKESRPEKVAELRPDVWYLDLDRITPADFKMALPKLETATGIIFDLRGYPNQIGYMPAILAHFTDKPILSPEWGVPLVTQPDHVGMEFEVSYWKPMPPVSPHIRARVAFITNESAISAAESWMTVVEENKLGAIVGGPTAGTNGDVNPFTLPGNYTIYWTGLRVRKRNSQIYQGIGVRPTVPVFRTIEGVTKGHDELLERALDVVQHGEPVHD